MSKPKRDPNVTDVEPVRSVPASPPVSPPEGLPQVPTPYAPPSGDVPMPGVENEPNLIFRPAAGCSILDVFEICLSYLLVMSNSPIQVAPGALRDVQMPADRAAMMSDSARRFMQTVQPSAPPAPPEPPKS